ncbi:DNA polymerase [Friedmanniella luteola]|uniref:Type-4 uracil-DNA glycosylase n=1 Tax=Friedmanniella luteola TaxID=546871 RepID=A0A1H1U3Z6_9ACTN|nr:UdgX family uracil-DNA binding protein [Friedmanniella luteola]SDS66609.1 DNA polymerase [Friedmanniella luteola]
MSAETWVPAGAGIGELRRAATECRGCELWEPATQVVFSAGNPRGPVMLVGEQPGDQEDRRGIPFVGPAGQLLQRALAEAGITVADLYVTNAVKHFRFTEQGKRRIHATPQATHIRACRPWLEAEVAEVDPRMVVALGATAAKAMLGPAFRITQQRGTVLELPPPFGPRPVLATLHPSAVLRTQAGPEQAEAFAGLVADLRTAAAAVAG